MQITYQATYGAWHDAESDARADVARLRTQGRPATTRRARRTNGTVAWLVKF